MRNSTRKANDPLQGFLLRITARWKDRIQLVTSRLLGAWMERTWWKLSWKSKGNVIPHLFCTFWIFQCWVWKKTLLPLLDLLALLRNFWVFSVLCYSHFTWGSWMPCYAALHDTAAFPWFSCYQSQISPWTKTSVQLSADPSAILLISHWHTDVLSSFFTFALSGAWYLLFFIFFFISTF